MEFNCLKNKINIYYRLMRIDKPVGILLLLWPTYWGLWLSNRGSPGLYMLFVFTSGVFLMRSSGCIINDFIDKRIDSCVKRTMYRPLIINKNISNKEVIILFFVLILLSFLIVLTLNITVLLLSFFAFLLVIIYPFIKRISYFPQVILGIAFGWPIPMAYAAIINKLPFECWFLMSINVIWSIIYDTVYAMIDRDDDIKIGIKSTAIFFGKFDILIIGILQIIMLMLLLCLGLMLDLHYIYFIAILLVAFLFIFQQKLIITHDSKLYLKVFNSNVYVGFFIFLGIFLNYMNMDIFKF